jgi:hypothetical protein
MGCGDEKMSGSSARFMFLLCGILFLISNPLTGALSSDLSARILDDTTSRALNNPFEMYEKSFKPSQYDADLEFVQTQGSFNRNDSLLFSYKAAAAEPETVQGYRVQILATNDYDEAVAVRASANFSYPDYWIYMVYDAPAYKIRLGDFMNRTEANEFLEGVQKQGYPSAWIVPDRVIKNPPPKPPVPVLHDSTNVLQK